MQRLDINRVIQQFQERTKGKCDVVASLHDIQEITPDVARVIVSLSTDRANPEKNYFAVANLFDNVACPIKGSFREIRNSRGEFAAVGFIMKNTEIVEASAELLGKMKVMAGNLMMDETDSSLWELRKVGNTRYISRKTEESLSELVEHASLLQYDRMTQLPGFRNIATASLESGEYVVYVSPQNMEVNSGFMLDIDEKGTMEVVATDGKLELVPQEYLIESTFIDISESEVTASEGGVPAGEKERMKEFYRKVFAYDTNYFDKLAAIIDNNAVL